MKTNGTKQKKIHETLFSHALRYTENRFMCAYVCVCIGLHANSFEQKRAREKKNTEHGTEPNQTEPIFHFHKNINVLLKCCIIVSNLFY